ncbi:MAG: type II secretion system F family protein [Pirellulaceae bacterium]|nr:type II secretion system F family protein [Pirellulaceae bacterium]
MTTWLAVLIAFFVIVGLVLAIARLFRDMSSSRYNDDDRRLGIDAQAQDIEAFYRTQDLHGGSFDQWFYRSVRESGVGINVPTALTLVLGGSIVGAVFAFVVTENLIAVAIGMVVGLVIPFVWLLFRRWRHIGVMREQLPEALQIIADGVRAGHSLEQVADMVGSEMSEPLAAEFRECASHLKLGSPPTLVMKRMTERISLPEFRVFATAAMVHQTAGGNLPLLTERLAHAARQRQEFTGHVNAVTAGSRLSVVGLVVGSIVAVGVLAWLEPEYIHEFIFHPVGPALLTLAAVLQLIGIFWVWRVMRVGF